VVFVPELDELQPVKARAANVVRNNRLPFRVAVGSFSPAFAQVIIVFITIACLDTRCSKRQLKSELHNARIMRIDWMQERIARDATGVIRVANEPRRILGVVRTVAVDLIVAGIARVRGIIYPELGVIKDIEKLSSKFEILLVECRESLNQ
jgi:hypothetical protein